MKTYVYVCSLLLLFSNTLLADNQQLLQLIDYIGVDYAEAVADGKLKNPAEYNEMLDFAAGVSRHVAMLPDDKATSDVKAGLTEHSKLLTLLIQQKESVTKIRQLTSQMHHEIISAYRVIVTPRNQPDLKKAGRLYSAHCASCHGMEGFGDGPASKNMEPPPIDFHDVDRYRQRTLYGLYNTITQGVADTGMKSYNQLSDDDRWSLAFYVGSLAAVAEDVDIKNSHLLNITQLTTTTPDQANDLHGVNGDKVMAYLRHHPDVLYNNPAGLAYSRQRLNDVLNAYKNNDHNMAYQYAVEAYLDGFELVEQNISAYDKSLKLEIETGMTGLRNRIRAGESIAVVENEIILLVEKLDMADELISGERLSGGTAFASAFFILLREGLEALLIVAALTAFLVRTKRQDGLLYIHVGWISALILGVLTWWASVLFIDISGASREITEGMAAIVATLVLLYVGFWMHDKTSVAKWKKFIDDSMHKALTSGTLWTLAGLSFIAVYREAFETILFYQSLWAQVSEAGQGMVMSGFITAVAILVVLAWLIMRYSVRLPLRLFFAVTGGLMFVLAVVFAGKGVAALQEAGLIVSSPVRFIRVDVLGIYPNLQGLLVQLGLVVFAVVLWNKKSTGR